MGPLTRDAANDAAALPLRGLVDSHCHLDDAAFDVDRDAVVRRATAVGVHTIIVPAYSPSYWFRVREVCARYPELNPAFGVHPLYLGDREADWEDVLASCLTNAVALGEIGLDTCAGAPDALRQRACFTTQLAMARELRLPVILHARGCVEEVILILRRFPDLRGVLHSFSGSLVQAQRLIDLGFLLGLGGALTHPRAQRLRATAERLPADSLLMETDAPWQPPYAHLGMRNEPAYLTMVIASLARLRHISIQEVARITAQNARSLFSLQGIPQ